MIQTKYLRSVLQIQPTSIGGAGDFIDNDI